MKIEHTNDDGVEEIYRCRKPSAKMIMKLTKLDTDNMEDEESLKILSDYIGKVIVEGPKGNSETYRKMDLAEDLEADLYFRIFADTAGPALKEAKKLSSL